MSTDALQLVSYFGERARIQRRLLADELIELHARHKIKTSVLLRGIQGFGAKHRLRTDRLLTLSEDLPLMSLAVDAPARIQALQVELRPLTDGGLTTIESATIGAQASTATDVPVEGFEELKLTVFVGRHERVERAPAFVWICEALHDAGVAGATVLLGVDGTLDGERERARFFSRNAQVPQMVISLGEPHAVIAAAAHIRAKLHDALLSIQHVRVCKRDGQLLQAPRAHDAAAAAPGERARQCLTAITSEAARTRHGAAVHLEIVKRLRLMGFAGATSIRGVWGFHGNHRPHGDRLLSLRRHVPVITIVIDTQERITEAFSIIDELTPERGLVTSHPLLSVSA